MHLFEFNDLPHVPHTLRLTLLELMQFCNRVFRSFNQRAAQAAVDHARQKGCDTIVELGAGGAPLTSLLAETAERDGLRLVPCDLYPDMATYRELEANHPGAVKPIYTPVDFSTPHDFGKATLAVLVGTFHHVPPAERAKTLQALTASAGQVMVFEPLRNTPLSISLALTSIVPVLLLPLYRFGSAGTWRRILWCWLLPVVPFVFLWDGVVSCLRQWGPARWKRELAKVAGPRRPAQIEASVHSLVACW
jgi:hypothetical protein